MGGQGEVDLFMPNDPHSGHIYHSLRPFTRSAATHTHHISQPGGDEAFKTRTGEEDWKKEEGIDSPKMM